MERQSSPADDDDASSFRADDGMAEAWAQSFGHAPCTATRWQKQVAEVAKALYQRSDELAVLLARAITRRRDRRRMFGGRRGGAAQIACTLSSIDVCSA